MPSSPKDNRPSLGSVGEFLRSQIAPETKFSFVSAYFTVNAYDALKPELKSAECLRFLVGEPSFIAEIDSDKHARKDFRLTEDGLELAHSFAQRPAATACADWITNMVNEGGRLRKPQNRIWEISERGRECLKSNTTALIVSNASTLHFYQR